MNCTKFSNYLLLVISISFTFTFFNDLLFAVNTVSSGKLPDLKTKKADPVVPFALERYPASCFEPQGRWKKSLRVIADSWIKRAAETEHPVYYCFLWEKDWSKGDFASPHYAVYVGGAYVRLSNFLPDSKLAQKYRSDWLPNLLDSQLENGYIGGGLTDGVITIGKTDSQIPRYELLSVDLILEFLLREYEHTGSPEVLQAAVDLKNFTLEEFINPQDYNAKLMETPAHQAICRSLTDIYRYTGDEEILDALKHYIDRQKNLLKGTFSKTRPHIHAVCYSYMLQAPLTMYHYTGDTELLETAMEGFENVSDFAMQTTGTLTGCEITLQKGCRKYTEHCAACEWKNACTRFLKSRGDVRFADIAERCMHNAYFGSKSPDGLSLTYYHTLNQLFATDWTGQYLRDFEPSDIFNGDYNMDHSPRCCNCITSKAFAQFIENSILKTPEGEITFVFYGPGTFRTELSRAGRVTVKQDTDYPYEDEINFRISLEKSADFPLRFRIPFWTRKVKMKINGETVNQKLTPGEFARIQRTWNNGDKIQLLFDFPITLEWDHSPAAGKGAAVVRGPLVYSLPVKAEWNYTGESPPSPENMKESWNVIMKEGQKWNVALEIDTENPEKSLKAVKLPVPKGSLPWQNSPVGLKVKARLLPDWKLDRISNNPRTPAIPEKIEPQGKPFEVTLVPFGFTRLRMTVLPVIGQTDTEKIEHGQHKADI